MTRRLGALVPLIVQSVLGVLGVLGTAGLASARPAPGPSLVALAPADDARKAIAIGPGGQVYAPDAAGDWVRTQAISTADTLGVAGRAGGHVVAIGDGVVYRLAANGWTAIRLVQKGKAVMSGGTRAVAAVGRQLFALDKTAGGEPFKLALAPQPVLAIGSGARSVVIATERGLLRLEGTTFKPVARSPRRVDRLISDRWALIARGAVDLRGGKITAWPAGLSIGVAAVGPDDRLVAVGSTRAGLELVTLVGAKLVRDPIAGTAGARAVGVVVDKGGRATVALTDGRLARRDRGTWALTTVREALPEPRVGAAPATSP
ncbi:hypothetical protein BH11MYX3_BH11MYX3_36570 [soil metagenome]